MVEMPNVIMMMLKLFVLIVVIVVIVKKDGQMMMMCDNLQMSEKYVQNFSLLGHNLQCVYLKSLS